MGFLDYFRNRRDRPSLTDFDHWDVDGTDFCKALRAFPELVPAGAVLGLQEGAWTRAVEDFAREHEVTVEAGVLGTLPIEFADARFVALDPFTIRALLTLAETHAETELAIHLVVVHNGVSLVEWYDLPGDPIAIRSSFDEARVSRFAAAAGGRERWAKAGK